MLVKKLAFEAFNDRYYRLAKSVDQCSSDAAELAAAAAKFLEEAFYEHEISEKDYLVVSDKLSKLTNEFRFHSLCECR